MPGRALHAMIALTSAVDDASDELHVQHIDLAGAALAGRQAPSHGMMKQIVLDRMEQAQLSKRSETRPARRKILRIRRRSPRLETVAASPDQEIRASSNSSGRTTASS